MGRSHLVHARFPRQQNPVTQSANINVSGRDSAEKSFPVRPSLKEILFLAIPVPHDAPIAPGCTAARATTVLPRQTHDAHSADFTTSAGRADIASRNRDRKVRAGELGCLCTQGTRPPVRCRAKPSQQMVNIQKHATLHPEAREVVGAEDNKPGSS